MIIRKSRVEKEIEYLELKEKEEAMSKNVKSVKAIQHDAIKELKEKVKKNQKRNLLQQLTSD